MSESVKVQGVERIVGANLAAALVKAQSEFPTIGMDETVKVTTRSGGSYTFRYATLAAVLAATRPVLNKNGLALLQVLDGKTLRTRLLHVSGESLEGVCDLPFAEEGVDGEGKVVPGMSTQERGSIISYFRRYSLVCILGVVAEEDDDGNLGDGNTVTRPAATRQPVKQPQPLRPVPAQEEDAAEVGGEVYEYNLPKDAHILKVNLGTVKVDEKGKTPRFYTKAADNQWYSTFDKKIGEKMVALSEQVVTLAYRFDQTPKGEFRTVLGVGGVSEEPLPF